VLESELFGHEKGAFTGAIAARAGRFELADKGTLFLDEVGEMSQAVQVKLLRVLQERRFERVGGVREIKSDFRLIAATNRNLEEAIQNKSFREDLFYRLNIIPMTLPPLRERREDIPLLVEYFIRVFNRRLKTKIQGIAPEALERLIAYRFPGNIRELENIIERTMVLARGSRIEKADLPQQIRQSDSSPVAPAVAPEARTGNLKSTLKSSIAGMEREYLVEALKLENGNRTNAAKRLGISRKSIQLKIKEYNLESL
jgi:transcriptional regulator with GAF, ATPase, and Fis domain